MPSIAELLLAKAQQQGQMWRGIGQDIASVPASIAQAQEQGRRADLQKMQLDEAKQNVAGEKLLDTALQPVQPQGPTEPGQPPMPPTHPYLDDQGLVDPTKVQQLFNNNGMAHIAPAILDRIDKQNTAITNFQQTQQKLKTQHAIAIGSVAHTALGLMDAGMDFNTATDHASQSLLATGLVKPDELQQALGQVSQQPPDQQRALLENLRDNAARLAPTKTLKEGEKELDIFNRPVASNAPKVTEADLQKNALDAYGRVAGGTQTPADLTTIAAWEKVHPRNPPKSTAEQDTERAVNIRKNMLLHQPISTEDQAWLQSHETEKTIGIDATTAAASLRQAQAINAQTAQQGRAQAFTEMETGKKQVAKIDEDYNKAKAGADNLRSIVAGAKAGNTIDASLQNMATTFAEVRAQGLNRVNAVELGLPAAAGSAWQRLQAWAGGKIQGQPVPESIQKDMLDFADLLDKAADRKYGDEFDGAVRLYPGLKGKVKPLTEILSGGGSKDPMGIR